MHRRILAASDSTHEVRLMIEEAATLTRVFNGHVWIVRAVGLPTMPELRGIYGVDGLREEVHHIASASLVELQRQFDADGTPVETGVLMLDATDDDIGNTLEHEAER